MNKLTVILIFGAIDTEVPLLTVVLKLGFLLMPVKVAVFGAEAVSAFELLWGFLGVSVGLLWEADDTEVDVGFGFFNELEDVALDVLFIVERGEFEV